MRSEGERGRDEGEGRKDEGGGMKADRRNNALSEFPLPPSILAP
jgi:hypothetical protein